MSRLLYLGFLMLCCSCSSMQHSAHKEKLSAKLPVNPVYDHDFPDPTVIYAEGKYYAYGTNSAVKDKFINVQVISSVDLQNWKFEGDALPVKPNWGSKDFWAPHVFYDAALKKYVLFYSAQSVQDGLGKCLGVAYADLPTGPFIDKGEPLLYGKTFEAIDPMAFIDPRTGKKLLYWGSAFEPIQVREMMDDWSDFKPGSEATALIWPSLQLPYSRLIEGAWLDFHEGKYYLYYSGDNCCGDKANYATLVARSDHAMGPFELYQGNFSTVADHAILSKDSVWLAPGHNSIFKDKSGKKWVAYHAIKRVSGATGYRGRVMCISPLRYKKGWPQPVIIQ
jgi:arabinan endo-1,5-alpha-L-arabinosidase